MGITDTIGLLGGIAGLFALGIEGYTMWQKRKPQLSLFTPFSFTGYHQESSQHTIFVLVRIANSSDRVAHLYLETLRAEILFKDRWYPVSVPSFRKDANMSFDLHEDVQHHAGIKSFQFFNKFDEAVVSLDYPYSCYIGMYCHSVEAINNAERLRLMIHDCNLTQYTIESDILKNDPEHWQAKK